MISLTGAKGRSQKVASSHSIPMKNLITRHSQNTMRRMMCTSKTTPLDKAAAPKSSSWQSWMLRSTLVVAGVPVLTGAGFVYNLRNDQEFRDHFEAKYPELIEKISGLGWLPNTTAESDDLLTSKPEAPHDVLAITTMKSGRRFKVKVLSNATIPELTTIVQEHGASANDVVVDVTFEDVEQPPSAVDEPSSHDDDNTSGVTLEEGEELPVSTWPNERPIRATKKIREETKLEWELISLRTREAKLKAEMHQGSTREIDSIQEELDEVSKQKLAIEAKLPQKKWFGLF